MKAQNEEHRLCQTTGGLSLLLLLAFVLPELERLFRHEVPALSRQLLQRQPHLSSLRHPNLSDLRPCPSEEPREAMLPWSQMLCRKLKRPTTATLNVVVTVKACRLRPSAPGPVADPETVTETASGMTGDPRGSTTVTLEHLRVVPQIAY